MKPTVGVWDNNGNHEGESFKYFFTQSLAITINPNIPNNFLSYMKMEGSKIVSIMYQ